MWHAMSECHKIQCHALSQAKSIDSTVAATRFSEAHIDLIKHLELELLDLVASFAAWVNAQTSYIGTINEWLKKGIDYVPEVTDDGTPPFSPGRLGAPPIFIICNNWATGIARIPESGVVYAGFCLPGSAPVGEAQVRVEAGHDGQQRNGQGA